MITFKGELEAKTQSKIEADAAVRGNSNKKVEGEWLVSPIMFNPTQDDIDNLGIKGMKIFDNHYSKETKEGLKYGMLSLLFSFNHRETLGDDTLPEVKYATYDIAVSNEDLISHYSGTGAESGLPYSYWKVKLIDARFNTLEISLNSDPATLPKDWVITEAKLAVAKSKAYSAFYAQKDANLISKEDRDAWIAAYDVSKATANEKKRFTHFNPETAMVQKQGHYAYAMLSLDMSILNTSRFNPLKEDIKFDKNAWNKIVSGDVTALNKDYSKNPMYKYAKEEGSVKANQPKLGVYMYSVIKKSTGYADQRVLSPSFPGNGSLDKSTFSEYARPRVIKGKWATKCFEATDVIETRLDIYELRNKVFGIDYKTGRLKSDGTAIVDYPYSFEPRLAKEEARRAPVAGSSDAGQTAGGTSDPIGEDLPF
jgi:hypothetical protein